MGEHLVDPKLISKQEESSPMRESTNQLKSLGEIIGQQTAVRRLREFALLYLRSGRPPAHILLTGIDGLGKRALALAFAHDYCRNCSTSEGQSLARIGDLMGILTNLQEGDGFIVADLGGAPRAVAHFLREALTEVAIDFVVDSGMFAKTIKVPLRRFTCIATAPSKAQCPKELVEAFPLILPLDAYSQLELAGICERLARANHISITHKAAELIAAASDGTPHRLDVLVKRLASLGKPSVSEEDIRAAGPLLGFQGVPEGTGMTANFDDLTGGDFEKVVASLLQHMGFRTQITKASGDGGIDIIATLDRPLIGGRYLIQCKRFGANNPVGAPTIRDFYGALTADRTAIKGIFITTSSFTGEALAFANGLPIELINGGQLARLLQQHGDPGRDIPSSTLPQGPDLFEGDS